jgi:type II secretory ATPase GspE/PulE/Tfp pilus assembly ATPase PilB-like protein
LKIHTSKDEATSVSIDNAVSAILEKALVRGATDVHIEPRPRNIVVRYRIDGWLQEAGKLPPASLNGILRNIKSRAGLDASGSGAPQSGSFRFEGAHIAAGISLATMPTVAGEKAVLHINRDLSEPATLESLGFWGNALNEIEMAVAEPHGLVIAADLQPAGGTLSLLGIVHLLNNPALNIATLEEVVGQQYSGITQSQLNPGAGINFTSGLQALLKQDPNVVMVGSLNDTDTIRVAVQASLGGRLILGGLHARDAAHGIKQILQLHAEPFMVASAFRLGIGQRFVRRLCRECREAYGPGEAERKQLRAILSGSGIDSAAALHKLELSAAMAGIGGDIPDSSTSENSVLRLFRSHPDGCPYCNFSGYNGRAGLHEVLQNTEATQKLLAKNAGVNAIRTQAIDDGMIPLTLDGLIKALRGFTTLEEVNGTLVS